MKNKIQLVLALILIIAVGFVGCTQNTQEADTQETIVAETQTTEVVEETEEVRQIVVGMSGGYKPYTFLNENDELVGFDVAVWKAIGEKIGAEVSFETSQFSGLFGKLDNGQLTTIANQITVTEERQEKYLFSVPYVYYGAQLLVHADNEDVVDLESLKGKKVGVGLGTNYESMIREFDVDGEIEIITYEDSQASLRDVALGRIDAILNDKLALLTLVNESGLEVKLGGEPVSELFNAFPFVKSEENEALLVEINAAIEELRADGTLSAISLEWFPIDITEE